MADNVLDTSLARRCLVVDDEPRLRQALVRLMQGDGFTCLEAGSGVEALEVLDKEPVALVLSDMRMPKMDGQELLRNLRLRYPDVAVVMITAVAEVEVAVACLALGAMDYITKPFVFEEVRARVAQALEKRRLLADNRDYQERLELRVKAQAERLETLFLASIQSLADALELKDPYTRGHSVRVSQYGVAIANTLGLGSTLVAQIELGGHLHDVGKIGVREEVLRKAGPLTNEEYEHIMTHPVLGWQILRAIAQRQSRAAQHRALASRALRWQGCARQALGNRHSARGPHHRSSGCVRRHDEQASVPKWAHVRRGDGRAAARRGDAVRYRGSGRVLRGRAQRDVRSGQHRRDRSREAPRAEALAHYSSNRSITPLRRAAMSARCWLDSVTCIIDAVCSCTTALTCSDVDAFCSATTATASISRASDSAS